MKNRFFLFFLIYVISKALYGQVVISSTGSSNAYVLSYPANLTELTTGLSFTFKANHSNTGGTTLQINSFSARAIKKQVDQDLEANEIRSGQVVTVIYDGTNFQVLSQSGLAISSSSWKDEGTVTYLIDATDSVGIGVSQPIAKLEVLGNASVGASNEMGVSSYGFIYGKGNTLNGDLSFISGASNKVDGGSSFVVGDNNEVIDNRVFMMGTNNNGEINNVFLFGNYLTAAHEGALMLGDHSTITSFSSTVENEFSARFDGGYRFFTTKDLTPAKSIYINNGGSIGVGVVAPTSKLELYSQGQNTIMRMHRDEDKAAALEFYNATAGNGANTDWRLIEKADGNLYIQYDQTDEDFADAVDLMSFQADNVKIGATLEVKGDLKVGGDFEAANFTVGDELAVSGDLQVGDDLVLSSSAKVVATSTGDLDLLPMAYGFINRDGTEAKVTSNVDVEHEPGTNVYEIKISDATNLNTIYPTVVVSLYETEGIVHWRFTDQDSFMVTIKQLSYDENNALQLLGAELPFSFVIYHQD